MQPINLKELDIRDLKCLAYDCLAQREEAERNLQAINQEIILRMQAKKDEPVN